MLKGIYTNRGISGVLHQCQFGITGNLPQGDSKILRPFIVSRSIVSFIISTVDFSPSIDPLSPSTEPLNISSFVSVEPIHLSKFKLARLVFRSSIFFLHSLNPPYYTANLHNTPATAISDAIPAMVPPVERHKNKKVFA